MEGTAPCRSWRELMRAFKILMTIALMILPCEAMAQDACIVLSSNIKPYQEAVQGFKAAFRGSTKELTLEKDPAAAGRIIAEIGKADCAVAVAVGSTALKFLKLRLSEKPIVFAMTLSPSTEGTEGRNITGVYLEPSPRDTLRAIKRLIPNATSVGILYSPLSKEYLSDAKSAAPALGLRLEAMLAPSVGDAIRQAPAIFAKSDVVWMIPDLVSSSQNAFKALMEASLKNSVPIFALSEKHVSAGALAALATDYRENGRQAAMIAQKVARGTAPSAVSREYAAKSKLVINMKTAQRLGLRIPKKVLTEGAEIYR